MKIVADTNILFSFFWKGSLTRRLLISSRFKLISPYVALKEIKKYKPEIKSKTRINEREFDKLFNELKITVNFIAKKEYSSYVKEAEKFSPDKTDAEFFALCLKEDCFLWSNDSLLNRQAKIRVLNTEEIINLIFG